jgi:tetratricopeptide (TPR) repeat protein
MNAEFRRVKEIFLAAVEVPDAAERDAYVGEACGQDEALRRQVDALLGKHAQAGSFLESPVQPVATVDEAAREQTGTVIGPYKLIEQVGEGGMGTVWMAQQQEPVKRLVAVKLIKAGMDSKQVIARFEAERQALALMDHANIARVLDGGTSSAGRPYFVMDLVKGVPITRYCDEHHLTPRQRLELFLPVCQAIQHAHQKGIIHRDLKPPNVLVALYDGKPVPKVIDFGVAKAAGQALTEKTLVTGFGNIVGTLEYMSPEQAEVNQLDIDTRSDIYSLGVLLYELLAGSPPFSRKDLEKAGMLEMLRVIREQEPSKPSTKLSTAEALPTLAANRSTEPAKLTKLVRGELDWIVMKALEKDRNRRYETANGFAMDVQRYLADEAVLACPPSVGYRLRKFARRNKGGLAVAALVLFFLVILGSGVGWAVRDRAARQATIEREVILALDEAGQWQAREKWPEALSAVKRAEGLLTAGGSDELVVRVRQLRNDLEMVETLEDIRLQGTEVDPRGVYLMERTDPLYEKAFRDYGIDVVALDPAEAAKRIQAQSIRDHLTDAVYDWLISTPEKARKDHLWAVLGLADPDEWRSAFRSAVWRGDLEAQRQLAAKPEFARLRPSTTCFLGRQLHNRGETSKALELLLAVQQGYPDDFWINTFLGWCYQTMKPPRLDQAIRYQTVAVALRPRSPVARVSLGSALSDSGSLDEAVAETREAIRLKPAFALAHNNLGVALDRQGKTDEAIESYRKAIEIDPKYALAHNNVGLVFAHQGKLDDAVAWFRKSTAFDPNYVSAHSNLGYTLYRQGKLEEAIAAYRKAIKLDPNHDGAHFKLGLALYDHNKLPEAVDAFRKHNELRPKHADCYYNIGLALLRQGKREAAIAAFKQVVTINPEWAGAHYALAWELTVGQELKLRDPKQALVSARRAVELDPKNGMYWQGLGYAEYRSKNWKAAVRAFEKVKELGSAGDSLEWFPLAMAYWQLGDKETARKTYDQAVQWMEKNSPQDGFLRGLQAEAAELMGVKLKKQ